MILKLVYQEEIHVYKLKNNQSFPDLLQKIKEIFKKLPQRFVLVYKNSQQQQISLKTKEQFDNIVATLKNDLKILKLFISPITHIPSQTVQIIPEQGIEMKGNQSDSFCIEMISSVHQQKEDTDKFVSLNEQQHDDLLKIAEIEKTEVSNKDHQNTKQEVYKLPQIELDSDKFQTSPISFSMLSIQEETKSQILPSERTQNQNQRELQTNVGQSSDPHDMIEIDEKVEKQPLHQGNHSEDERQHPIVPMSAIKMENLEQNKQLKSKHEQHIIPSFCQKVLKKQPVKEVQVQDDFRSHNVKCDICNIFPILGARFKCVLCQNYDLCEKCEQKYSHQHPMLKICYSYQAPISITVEIPEFNIKSEKQAEVVLEKEDIKDLDQNKRIQRIQHYSSEISELLGVDIAICHVFVKANEQYTKETLVQLMIRKKLNTRKIHKEKEQFNLKGYELKKFFDKAKNFFQSLTK